METETVVKRKQSKVHLWWQIPVALFIVFYFLGQLASFLNKDTRKAAGLDNPIHKQAYVCLADVRKIAKDPSSIEMINYGTNSDGNLILTYRGRNSYGAFVTRTRNCGGNYK